MLIIMCLMLGAFNSRRAWCLNCREIERAGGLTSGVRDDVLFVLDSLIKLSEDLDPDLGTVFSQILVSIHIPRVR